MSEIKVSVVVPVYQCENDLPRCAGSILTQSFSEYELVFVDDGSRDSGGSICDKVAIENSKVSVIHKPNAGVSSARNDGIKISCGEYITFCDSDDELYENALEFLFEGTKDGAELVLGGVSNTTIDKRRNSISTQRRISRDKYCLEKNQFSGELHRIWRTDNVLSIWAKLFKRSIVIENTLFLNENFVVLEDYDFVLAFLSNCKYITSISEFVYKYFSIKTGVPYYAKRSRLDYADDVISAYNKQKQFMNENKIEEKEDTWYIWKDLFGNFGTALSALFAVPTPTLYDKLKKAKRISQVLKDPAYRKYTKFQKYQFTKMEYFYMRHSNIFAVFLLKRLRDKLGK